MSIREWRKAKDFSERKAKLCYPLTILRHFICRLKLESMKDLLGWLLVCVAAAYVVVAIAHRMSAILQAALEATR